MSCAGRIFLSPQGSKVTQFWINLGYDTYDGYQIPPWIPEFIPICSKQQYDELMDDVDQYFKRYSQGTCCSFTIRHRPKFDEGLERLLRYHQKASQKWRPGEVPTISAWKPGTMKYAYGVPRSIAPSKAYDSRGDPLITQVEIDGEFIETTAWPPPYYSIIFIIPPRIMERIRKRWPGENPEIVVVSPRRSFTRSLSRAFSMRPSEETQITTRPVEEAQI